MKLSESQRKLLNRIRHNGIWLSVPKETRTLKALVKKELIEEVDRNIFKPTAKGFDTVQ